MNHSRRKRNRMKYLQSLIHNSVVMKMSSLVTEMKKMLRWSLMKWTWTTSSSATMMVRKERKKWSRRRLVMLWKKTRMTMRRKNSLTLRTKVILLRTSRTREMPRYRNCSARRTWE